MTPLAQGTSRLAGLVASPYFQPDATRRIGNSLVRGTQLIPKTMVNKYMVIGYVYDGPGAMGVQVDFIDSSSNTVTDRQLLDLDLSVITDPASQQANAQSVINTYISGAGYTIAYPIWPFLNAVTAPVASALSLSLQTSTGAVGTQVSTTRNANVMLNGNVSTTASIGGNAAGDIILEVAPTNSATAGDWVEWGRIGNSQTISLAIALNSVQITKGMAVCYVPAGYYVKARTAGSGTVSYTLTNAKQILV